MPTEKHAGGRPPAKILTDDFKELERVDNNARMLHHLSAMKLAESYERLFSDLDGIQNVKRCNLTVRTFETLGKLRNNYSYHVHQRALAAGQPVRRKHAHIHTRNNGGIDTDLAMDLDTNFAWTLL
ncbi:hypothetical protein BDR04DRAFT_1094698, partial [Suillus decipiens]